jgi:hypothetical protein
MRANAAEKDFAFAIYVFFSPLIDPKEKKWGYSKISVTLIQGSPLDDVDHQFAQYQSRISGLRREVFW